MARSDMGIALPALAFVVVLAGFGLVLASRSPALFEPEATPSASPLPPKRAAVANAPSTPTREALVLSDDEKEKGHWECATPDPGNGRYAPVERVGSGGLVQLPDKPPRDDGTFDLVLHFHGFSPVRKAMVVADTDIAFAGWDFGNGTDAYVEALRGPDQLARFRGEASRALEAKHGPGAKVRHLGLSCWSAGCAAVAILLKQSEASVDAVVVLDGMHASFLEDPRKRQLDERGLGTYLAYAERARKGEALMVVTHSKIFTEGYASTSETGLWLAQKLGEKLVAAEPSDDPLGLRSFVDAGGFHLRAYGGADKRAHCDHTRHMTMAARDVLAKTWGR